jgi:hypothetical protein
VTLRNCSPSIITKSTSLTAWLLLNIEQILPVNSDIFTMTSTEPHLLDRFNQASLNYLIPTALLAANLAAYLNKDESRPYEILGLNVFANIWLLYAYFRGDRTAAHAQRSGAVSS